MLDRLFRRASAPPVSENPPLAPLVPIGVVQNDRTRLGAGGWETLVSRIAIADRYAGGLAAIDGFSHLLVLTWLHLVPAADRVATALRPAEPGYPAAIGVFALRVPARPNPIGVAVVRLLGRDGATLQVRGLDAVNGTPVLDLKPYLPRYDSVPEASLPGWAALG